MVFTKLLPDDKKTGLLSSRQAKQDAKFKVKQRKKNKPGMDGRQLENKVTVVTIDGRSEEEERKIEKLTVEDVIKENCKSSTNKQNGLPEEGEKHSVTFSFPDNETHDTWPSIHEAGYTQSKVSQADSLSSGAADQKHAPKVKPTQPTFGSKGKEVDLDIIGSLSVPNGQRPLSNEADQPGSVFGNRSSFMPRPTPARAGSAVSTRSGLKSGRSSQQQQQQQRSLVSTSLINMGSQSYRQNDTEYIQISRPVNNPNTAPQKKQQHADLPSHRMEHDAHSMSGIREPAPSPELANYDDIDMKADPTTPIVDIKPIIKNPTPALSISIPTADFTDSAMNSPTRRGSPGSSPQMRRAKDMRDEQIDQITNLLVDAIIAPNDAES